mmetsp:Transcript_61351/g.177965  ORF Transcript_61351/g.177965 Transcript_61351/m.177965 type:complete len:223 (-) Transcript_61351:122-790(-)|eukprot:CAMPEP_0170285150 /NCGR_PEP_ID=MMETSP0116_2-20130129/42620_1 /TAXON_ID=400756 /ORGANISM="Durinskia baltica, Strain CSIRO CS-38" /LENGTH=222 /DNA_ID=CAMNT_0010536543 /DNA_START=15 /DNA_END=683 /DNA_ORIENTATION=+
MRQVYMPLNGSMAVVCLDDSVEVAAAEGECGSGSADPAGGDTFRRRPWPHPLGRRSVAKSAAGTVAGVVSALVALAVYLTSAAAPRGTNAVASAAFGADGLDSSDKMGRRGSSIIGRATFWEGRKHAGDLVPPPPPPWTPEVAAVVPATPLVPAVKVAPAIATTSQVLASCAAYGCVEYIASHVCQCNAECGRFSSCCSDFKDTCLNNVDLKGYAMLLAKRK